MPELPEVEVFRKEVAEDAVGEIISSVSVGIPKMIKFITPSALTKALQNQKITATSRFGKNLLLKTNNGLFLRLHFGMTGYLQYEKDDLPLPQYTCIALHFKSGKRLIFVDPRKFGAVQYIDNLDDFLVKAHIGPDVETLTQKEFASLLKDRKRPIKITLMDQSLMSGLGNLYTDEILFQARIHPETAAESLSSKELTTLYKKIRSVIKEAIKDHAEREQMPVRYLINHRKQGETCPQCKRGKIHMKTIGGRSTYFCDFCQKEPN